MSRRKKRTTATKNPAAVQPSAEEKMLQNVPETPENPAPETQPAEQPAEPKKETAPEVPAKSAEPAKISEVLAEPEESDDTEKKEEPKESGSKSNLRMMIFGAVILVFAVIGLISSITAVSSGISSLVHHEARQEEYEWLITPLVLQDPPQFESPEDIPDSTLITAGVWRLIMNEDTSKYPRDDLNFITVPASDIEVQIKALFGDVKYEHHTVGDAILMVMYEEDIKSYVFPAVPHILAYTPEVQKIEKPDDETTVLTVGYIPPGPVWQGNYDGRQYRPEAEKIMQYTLKRNENNEWLIYSISGDNSHTHPGADHGKGEGEGVSAPEISLPEESSAEPAEGETSGDVTEESTETSETSETEESSAASEESSESEASETSGE